MAQLLGTFWAQLLAISGVAEDVSPKEGITLSSHGQLKRADLGAVSARGLSRQFGGFNGRTRGLRTIFLDLKCSFTVVSNVRLK